MDFITLAASLTIQCQTEFNELAAKEKFKDQQFREVVADHWNKKFYRSLNSIIGEGYEIQLEPKKSPLVLKISNQKIEKISFNNDCLPKISEESLPWYLEKAFQKKKSQSNFDDEVLKKLVDLGKPAIIYSWSPKYVYSVLDLPRVQQIAEKLGYTFQAVVDPRVSESEVREALKKIKPQFKLSRKLASSNDLSANISYELYFRGGFNHFPLTYIVNNKKIHSRYIVGVMKDEGYVELMKTLMKEL